MGEPSTADRLVDAIRHAQTIVDNDPDRTLRESARTWINQETTMSDADLDAISRAKSSVEQTVLAEYRRTHSADGHALGSPAYPDNREGRRALARSWKRQRS